MVFKSVQIHSGSVLVLTAEEAHQKISYFVHLCPYIITFMHYKTRSIIRINTKGKTNKNKELREMKTQTSKKQKMVKHLSLFRIAL